MLGSPQPACLLAGKVDMKLIWLAIEKGVCLCVCWWERLRVKPVTMLISFMYHCDASFDLHQILQIK